MSLISADKLAASTGLSQSHAIVVLATLQTSIDLSVWLAIYCCRRKEPVGLIPFGDGFPALPYTCPKCGKVHETEDGLRYEIMAGNE